MEPQTNLHIASLVSTALGQTKLLGISEMLKTVAKAVNAYGCILWQVAPAADLDARPAKGNLFVLAEWFPDDQQTALHDLPLSKSITGLAVIAQRVISIEDVTKDQRVFYDRFMKRAGIKSMCSIPITFPEGVRGALNLYRKTPDIPFREGDVALTQQLASLVPALYQTIRHEVSFSLISKINELLHQAELLAPDAPLPKQEMINLIQHICDSVADAFQCLEASIFLENRLEAAKIYQLIATTWPRPFGKTKFRAGEPSLTGWVLKNVQPVRIFDLVHFKRDADLIRREYPRLKWADSLRINRYAPELFRVSNAENLPPLSFMAVPIVKGDRVYGVVRCCAVKKGPYYFAEREVNLLKLVAEQISRYWSTWLNRSAAEIENRSLQALVKNISQLNSFVHRELNLEQPDERRIFAKALRATSIIPGAEIMDVRQYDENSRELFFAEVHGKAWGEGTEREGRMERRYRVTGSPPASAGAHAFQTGKLYEIPDVSKDPYYSEMFPETRRMIIAPIKIEDKRFGVLDIRGTGDREFPRQAKAMAELLGHQLGMYSYLAATIGELRRTKGDLSSNVKELRDVQRRQIQTFQDLTHQIRTPIMQAHKHVLAALTTTGLDQKLKQRLWAIRGLCAKAKRISYNIQLFSALAKGENIELKIPAPIVLDELLKLLIGAAEDNRLMISSTRNIDFHVITDRFEGLDQKYAPIKELVVDRNLLEQAITDVLDNAGKYSYPNTVVRISSGRTGSDKFFISVENKGIRIDASEISKCTERGWRGEKAILNSDAGSGIGLWIVDNIMKAHSGMLIIDPTTREDITTVRLIFPAERVK